MRAIHCSGAAVLAAIAISMGAGPAAGQGGGSDVTGGRWATAPRVEGGTSTKTYALQSFADYRLALRIMFARYHLVAWPSTGRRAAAPLNLVERKRLTP